MTIPVDTMPAMSKKTSKPGGSDEPPKKPRPGYPIFARVDEDLGLTIEEFLDAQLVRPTLTALIETALKQFFKSQGCWPRKPKKGGGQ